jgi:hypothetical protein
VGKVKKDLFFLTLAAFLATLFVWLPFFFDLKEGITTVFKNYDGPNYIVIAKTWYDQAQIASRFSLPTPLEYYPAHLPGYPFSIFVFDLFLPGTWAMLGSTLIFSILCLFSFYLLVYKFKLSKDPFSLSLLFLIFPARWVAVKAVGSPEPMFLFFVLSSIYFFKSAFDKVENNLFSKKKNVYLDLLLAGIFGGLAQITKSPGILLFAGFEIFLFYKMIKEKGKAFSFKNLFNHIAKPSLPLLLIPLSALLVFGFYQIRTGNFWAYFHSGDNFHLFFPPYQAFSPQRSWLGDFWREDMVWQYLLGALTVVFLIKKKLFALASFAGVFFSATLFVAHRDLARYSLPLIPFSLIAFDEFLQKKEFKIALFIIIPAVYLFAINFIAQNTAPVADWTPYL